MKRIGHLAWVVGVAVSVAGCSLFPSAPAPVADRVAQPALGPVYLIGPGDHLSIFVFQSPQLSISDVPVRPDGRISIPLVADVIAAGRTPSDLGRELTTRFKKFVRDPNVTVMVREFIGPFDQQIRIIGEATEPVSFPFRNQMTVLDAMILAKGLTRYAAGNSSVIIRRDGDRLDTIKVRLSDLLKDGDIDQNVDLKPGDTLIIPQTLF